MDLLLRDADINDAEIILEWRNDSLTSDNSFSKNLIDYETHIKWYESKLSDNNCYLYILMDGNEKIGHLRIDRVDDVGRISYTIAPEKRKKGYGKKMIALSESVVTGKIKALLGMVKDSNEPSKKCFRYNKYAEFVNGDIYCFIKTINRESDNSFSDRFIFRNIRQEEAGQAASIEEICFPPNEACSSEMMYERIEKAPEFFLVAEDKDTGKIAGFLSGLATDEKIFRDEFFKDARMHNPNGRNIMLLGLDVLPAYRRRGLARELMHRYLARERDNNRHTVILTCLDAKVGMYEKMGFKDEGISASTWGGEQWHEMRYTL